MEELNIQGVRRLLLKFERAANKNQDQRSKYPDDPTKCVIEFVFLFRDIYVSWQLFRFIDSEADLDAAIKGLLPLAQAPIIAYPELVRSGAISQLIGLLSHENADIVIDVVEVIHELTDEEVGNELDDDDEEEGGEGSREEALKTLIEGLVGLSRSFSFRGCTNSRFLVCSLITLSWNCSWITCRG